MSSSQKSNRQTPNRNFKQGHEETKQGIPRNALGSNTSAAPGELGGGRG